jgi:hypothetical protein
MYAVVQIKTTETSMWRRLTSCYGTLLGGVEGRCVLIMWGYIVKTGSVGDNIVWNVLASTDIILLCYDSKYTGL